MCSMRMHKDGYRYKACATAFLVLIGTLAAAMKTFLGMGLVLIGYEYPGCTTCKMMQML